VSEKSTRKAPDYAVESSAARNRSVFRPQLQLCVAILLKSGIICANQDQKRRFQFKSIGLLISKHLKKARLPQSMFGRLPVAAPYPAEFRQPTMTALCVALTCTHLLFKLLPMTLESRHPRRFSLLLERISRRLHLLDSPIRTRRQPMKLASCIAMIACLAVPSSLPAQGTINLSQQDLEAAQYEYTFFTIHVFKSLYEAPVAFPDGARGYVIQELYRDGSHYGDYNGNPAHDSLMLTRNEDCRASLVVLARATGVEQVVLSPNQQAIFTATQFKIERILKNSGSSSVGDDITYMYPGGTFKGTNGILLRTQFEGKPLHPFKSNGLYLLTLRKVNDPKYQSSAFFSMDTHQVEIIDGHVRSTARMSDPVIPNRVHYGENFEAYWKRVSDFLAAHPCP